MLEAVTILDAERSTRCEAAAAITRELARALPKLPIVRLPFIEAAAPDEVMALLAVELAAHVDTLLP